jgi:hypothetical protein
MLAPTTQGTVDIANKDGSASLNALPRSVSVLETDDFNKYIQDYYGACWGTLKFEDSLSDYSNEVKILCYEDFIF